MMHSGSYFRALLVTAALCLPASAHAAGKTLWLFRPLYPGQEALIERTEKSLDTLLPADARKDATIGKKEFAAAQKGKVVSEVPCFSPDARCGDPVDAFVASFGFEQVLLVQGGQDDTGYKFVVTAYDPRTGKSTPASSANTNEQKAFLGALAKVSPVTSTLTVNSAPSGASVYVDDVKVGVTPIATQVLPGERTVRIDLKMHQPLEETVTVPIRGSVTFEKQLEKVAARIVLTASPAGTEIFVDGVSMGKDRVDRGIAPGDHTVRFVAEGYKAYEQTIAVKADQQFMMDKALESIAPAQPQLVTSNDGDKVAVLIRDDKGNVTPVEVKKAEPDPSKMTDEERIYHSKAYVNLSFAWAHLTDNVLVGRRFTNAPNRTTTFIGNPPKLAGAQLEFGMFGKYFGMAIFGFTYATGLGDAQMNVGHQKGLGCETDNGVCKSSTISKVQLHLGLIQFLQPQVRLAVWRFQFAFQLGLEARLGWILGRDPSNLAADPYKDGFMITDGLISARLNVKFFIYQGFYLNLQAGYSMSLFGWRSVDDAGKEYGGFPNLKSGQFLTNFGVGYAF